MKTLLLTLFIFSVSILMAQSCFEDNHSINVNDSWLSCAVSTNPNPEREDSHWIMYDLGYVYSITTTHFWNYNVLGETANGMHNIVIDVSWGGNTWTEIVAFELSEAYGNNEYMGEEGPDLGGAHARYVLITALDTWGNGDCAGLSEVRFDLGVVTEAEKEILEDDDLAIFPNPANNVLFIETEIDLKEVIILNLAGNEMLRTNGNKVLDISHLPQGMYIVRCTNGKHEIIVRKLVKQ